ncbi:hypothetical protein KI387_022824, partial [Taxus chinensis]
MYTNHKVVVIGLPESDYHSGNIENSIMVFDICSGKWKKGTDMPVCRDFFSCSLSPQTKKHIYIAGGYIYIDMDLSLHANQVSYGAAVYSMEDNRWEILPGMGKEFSDDCRCDTAFMDGNFLVVRDDDAKFYDPEAREWKLICTIIDRRVVYVGVFGRLYWFELKTVKEYNSMENKWSVVGLFPECLHCVNFATKWNNEIFVSGIDESRGRRHFSEIWQRSGPTLGLTETLGSLRLSTSH